MTFTIKRSKRGSGVFLIRHRTRRPAVWFATAAQACAFAASLIALTK